MAIGAIWGEIWSPIWNTAIWSQDAVEPPAEPEATQKPAGRRRKRRFLVEIDGQEFEVSSPSQAAQLLEQAKQVAQAAIEKARAAPVRVARGIARPRITTKAPELRKVVSQARREIVSLYEDLARDMEIAALMAKQMEDEEDEALIRLLM